MKEYYPEGFLSDTLENTRNMNAPAAVSIALSNKTVLEATALLCDEQHNITVDLGCMKGIIPREEGAIGIREGTTRDIALISRVGKPVCFVVTDIKTDNLGRLYAVLSRRCAQEQCKRHFLSTKRVGDIIRAKITHLESFGAFCDIGCGNIALLPIDSISVSRISHPRDRFRVGDDIRAIIKSVSPDGKITLSHKELLGTWEENASLFSQGRTVSGIVRSIEDYGVFVELTANLAGLAEPKNDVYIGQQASVYIKSIIPEKMKIKLIIIDSFNSEAQSGYEYFYNGDRITYWSYSPEGCRKTICSEFLR